MSDEAWNAPFVRCLGVQLFGDNIDVDEHGETISGDTMLLLFNADHANTIPFMLPPTADEGQPWELVFDTAGRDQRARQTRRRQATRCSPARWWCCKPGSDRPEQTI